MLEDGEIGEEDFTSQPVETPITATSPTASNTSANKSNKSNNSKRKSRELNLNKRKKLSKHHQSKLNDDEENDWNDENDLNEAYNSNLNADSNEFLDNDDNLFSKNDYDSRLDDPTTNSDSIFNLGGDRYDRESSINKRNNSVPKYQSLMSATVSSSWSTPMSKKDIKENKVAPMNNQAPKSLLDLFLTTGSSMASSSIINEKLMNDSSNPNFIDPVIIEKENKPKYKNNTNNNNNNNNSKTNQFNRNNNNFKRKNGDSLNDDEEESSNEKLISTESIEKKLEKKRKYIEIQKEKQKAKEMKQQVREPILCKFFLEGRCQKGNECPFSHNAPINKKFEVCKYYLNGFCAKEDKCLYMHSDFPCKFFHRKNFQTGLKMNQCLHGDACRFSHSPITNPLLLEAFEKHLTETEDKSNTPNASNKLSLLGSPPHSSQLNNEIPSLMTISIKTPSNNSKTSSLSPPSSPPQPLLASVSSLVNPLMGSSSIKTSNQFNNNNEPKKQPLLATPTFLNNTPPTLMSNPINPLMGSTINSASRSNNNSQKNIPIFADINSKNSTNAPKPLSLFSNCEQDVDERSASKPSTLISTNIPLISVSKDKLLQTNDVDERSIPLKATSSISNTDQYVAATSQNQNTIKQELVIKIMKSIADENGGVFSQIPKQTLTELLVKLLNSNDNNQSDGVDVIINLLTSLSNSASSPSSFNKLANKNLFDFNNNDDDKPNSISLNESSSNLQIDLRNPKNKKYDNGACSDYDDDDEDDYDLIIEGSVNDMPYKLIELDVEPSKLWSDPPQLLINNLNGLNDPIALAAAAADQESDPRIKYYSNNSNCMNVANFQLQLQQQHQLQQLQHLQQMTPTSPSSNSSSISIQTTLNSNPSNSLLSASASSPSGQNDSTSNKNTNKPRIADPRLLRNQNSNNNMSPTRSISPTNHEQFFGKSLQQQNDLISIQNRQLTSNSLLSSLPDLQFPKDSLSQLQKNPMLNSLMQQQQNESNTVKLSIEDYKRKLQKPSNNNYNNNTSSNSTISSSILTSITANSTSIDLMQQNNSNQMNNNSNAPSLPSIPSYLQAPQSLHELLRNFQS